MNWSLLSPYDYPDEANTRTERSYSRVEYCQDFHQRRLCWADRYAGHAGNTFDIGRDAVVPGRQFAGRCRSVAAAQVDGTRSLTWDLSA